MVLEKLNQKIEVSKMEVNSYDGWIKNPKSTMISCNGGFSPVRFLIELMD